MDFIYDIYTVRIDEDEDEGFDINLYNSDDLLNTLIYLKLKPLWQIDTSLDDKGVVRDIPRYLFNKDDYYQASTTRHTKAEQYNGLSLLSIIHNAILENTESIPEIGGVYSSSLNGYIEEGFITPKAEEFWKKQLQKAPVFPVVFFEEDNRYKFNLKK